MPNDSRNDKELPCYLDAGAKLFPEAMEGQTLDFIGDNRDTMFVKHTAREGQQKGMKPVRIWLFSHEDARSNNTGPATGSAGIDKGDDFYGDGGAGTSAPANYAGKQGDGNLYNEMREKVFVGPFTVYAEYQPNQGEHVLMDMGVEKNYKDAFFFLRDDIIKTCGRVPSVGDIVERFDGKMMEILTSVEAEAVNWVWMYQFCTAINTNKPAAQLFRE